MKALSLWQPWADAIFVLLKANETRSWSTAYRGPLVIHAAQSRQGWKDAPIELFGELSACERKLPHPLTRGALIGVVELVDVVPMLPDLIAAQSPTELLAGDWREGRFAWRLRDPFFFLEPIPFRGHQELFDVPDELVAPLLGDGFVRKVTRHLGRHGFREV